ALELGRLTQHLLVECELRLGVAVPVDVIQRVPGPAVHGAGRVQAHGALQVGDRLGGGRAVPVGDRDVEVRPAEVDLDVADGGTGVAVPQPRLGGDVLAAAHLGGGLRVRLVGGGDGGGCDGEADRQGHGGGRAGSGGLGVAVLRLGSAQGHAAHGQIL